MLNSRCNAVFSLKALLPIFTASLNSLCAPPARNKVSLKRTSLIPISCKIPIAVVPLSFAVPKPSTNAAIACSGCALNKSANASAVIPDTPANSLNLLPALVSISSTATAILIIILENALPPFSASIPTELNAVARPNTVPSDSPICLPAPAKFLPMSKMSFSVVAKWLPNSTNVEPRLDTLSCDVPIIFMNFARSAAPSSPMIFVAVCSFAIVSTNVSKFSLRIPNCPAICPMFANSLAATGISVDILRNPKLNSCNCAVVGSVVLRTPAIAFS